MNLDKIDGFSKLDAEDMLGQINGLPDQLYAAWELGLTLPLGDLEDIKQVVVAGMGGSAIGAALLQAYTAPQAIVPLTVHRDYRLPAWVEGPGTLFIASSHSGNTEETLAAFQTAADRGCRLLVITTGGELAERGPQAGADVWTFQHLGQPRSAVGFSFGLLLAAAYRAKIIPDPADELADAVQEMRSQQALLTPDIPTPENPAKRSAGQLMGRWVCVFGADFLAPVARRWKGQINELAKSWAQFEALPEADHNTLAGVVNPEEALLKTMALFLVADENHPRNQRRVELTKMNFMLEGLNTDLVRGRGGSRLAQMWTLIHFGDYTAYYLAMLYGVDPTPVASIENLKSDL